MFKDGLSGTKYTTKHSLLVFTHLVEHIVVCKGKVGNLNLQGISSFLLEVEELTSLIGHIINDLHYVIVGDCLLLNTVVHVGGTYETTLQLRIHIRKVLHERYTCIGKHTSIASIQIIIRFNLTENVCESFNRHTDSSSHIRKTLRCIYNIFGCNIVSYKLFRSSTKFHCRKWRLDSHCVQFREHSASVLCAINKNTDRAFKKLVLTSNVNERLYELRGCSYRKVESQTILHIVP